MRIKVPSSGVTVGNPEFEWREVAKSYHLTYVEFDALPIDEKAVHIAHHRVSQQIAAVLNWEAAKPKTKR